MKKDKSTTKKDDKTPGKKDKEGKSLTKSKPFKEEKKNKGEEEEEEGPQDENDVDPGYPKRNLREVIDLRKDAKPARKLFQLTKKMRDMIKKRRRQNVVDRTFTYQVESKQAKLSCFKGKTPLKQHIEDKDLASIQGKRQTFTNFLTRVRMTISIDGIYPQSMGWAKNKSNNGNLQQCYHLYINKQAYTVAGINYQDTQETPNLTDLMGILVAEQIRFNTLDLYLKAFPQVEFYTTFQLYEFLFRNFKQKQKINGKQIDVYNSWNSQWDLPTDDLVQSAFNFEVKYRINQKLIQRYRRKKDGKLPSEGQAQEQKQAEKVDNQKEEKPSSEDKSLEKKQIKKEQKTNELKQVNEEKQQPAKDKSTGKKKGGTKKPEKVKEESNEPKQEWKFEDEQWDQESQEKQRYQLLQDIFDRQNQFKDEIKSDELIQKLNKGNDKLKTKYQQQVKQQMIKQENLQKQQLEKPLDMKFNNINKKKQKFEENQVDYRELMYFYPFCKDRKIIGKQFVVEKLLKNNTHNYQKQLGQKK